MLKKIGAGWRRMLRGRSRKFAIGLGLALVLGIVGTAYAEVYGDPLGAVAIGTTSNDNPSAWLLAVGNGGTARGYNFCFFECSPTFAVNTTGSSYSYNYFTGVSISGTGHASGPSGISISGAGDADGAYGWVGLAVSGTGNSAGSTALSGTGNANGGTAISGLGDASGGTAISGLGNATGNVGAISGTGTAISPGNGIYPGVAISGANNATGRDVAISGTGTAAANDDDHADLVNVSEGEVWVGDITPYINTGILAAAQTVQHLEHIAYQPDPVAAAIKEAGLAQIMPEVLYNMATGPLQGGASASSSNNNSDAVASGPPPRTYSISPVMEAQKFRKFCVPATVRSILCTSFGTCPSQEDLAYSLGTDCWDCTGVARGGTLDKSALVVLNQRQGQVMFLRRMPSDASHLMGALTYALFRENHMIALSVELELVEHNLNRGLKGRHMLPAYGYHHDTRKVDLYDVYDVNKCTSGRPRCWNPKKLRDKYPYGSHRLWTEEDLVQTYKAVKARGYSEEHGGVIW